MKRILFVIALVVLVGAGPSAQSGYELLQQALSKEQAEGKVAEAIVIYQRIAKEFASDRALAAKALLRLGEAYQKLGDRQAQQAFERIVRDYSDQKEAAANARARLLNGRVNNGPGDATVMERQQVWVGDDVNLEGLPSSDGHYLAYVERSKGNGELAVRDLRTGRKRLLAGARGSVRGFPEFPAISPDGQFIAFGWLAYTPKGDRYSINVVRFDGTGAREVAAPAIASIDGLVWAPDGTHLAAVILNKDRTRQLAVLSVATGSMTQLRSSGSRPLAIGGFSPDGRFLTFVAPPDGRSGEEGSSDIFTIALDGSSVSPLVQGLARDSQPQWTPDGRAVVFVSDRSGTNSLWAVRVHAGSPVGLPHEIRPNIGTIVNMGFSRTGRLLYGVSNSSRDIYIASVDPETLRVTSTARPLTDQGTGFNSAPEWSPDGRFIAFLRGPHRRSQTIVIRSLADGLERTLPTKIVDAVFPMSHGFSWTPDGRSLVLRDSHPSQERRIVVRRIDVETGQDVVLFEAGEWDVWSPLKLSPDGVTVFYTAFARDPNRNMNQLRLMKRDLSTGQETQLLQRETGFFSFYGLLVSPDGSRLVFLDSVAGGPRALVQLPSIGGTPVELSPNGSAHPRPTSNVGAWMRAWTPDGRFVITKTADNGVWALPAGPGAPRKLDWPLPEVGTLSRDGKQTAFTLSRETRELRTIDNLLSRIRTAE